MRSQVRKMAVLVAFVLVLTGLTAVAPRAAHAATGPQVDTKTPAFSATGTATASVSTTVAGDLLVAFVSGDQPGSSGAQTATVTSPGLTWTLAKRVNGQPGTAEIWWAQATGTLSGTAVSAKLAQIGSGGTNIELLVEAFSNAAGIGTVSGASALNGAPKATLTTTAASSWVWGVGFDWSNGTARTVGSGQTLQDQVLQTGGTFWTQSRTSTTASSGSAVTINDTAPTGDRWDLATAEILAASTSGAPVISNATATQITSSGATITWTTNVAATSQVDYGPTSSYGSSTPLDSSLVTSHSVTLSGLTASSTYHYRADSGNSNGTSQTVDATFTTSAANQASGPQLDTKTAAFSGSGTATASVSTTAIGDLLVAFVSGDDPSSSFAQSATVSASGLTWTLVERTDGVPGTAEIWTARAGGTLSSLPVTATLAQAANVELVVEAFSNAAGTGAVGTGHATSGAPTATLTTTAANSWVYGVGFDWSQGLARTLGSGQTLVDQVLQTGGTFWTQSRAVITPSSGTAVTINDTAPSGDYWDLSTVEILSGTPAQPATISNVGASQITASGATITWTTDQASTSQVNYGTTASYGSSSPLDSNPVTSHSVSLSGLTASTTYHYQVVSGNTNGTSQSADATFTTSAAGQPPAISSVVANQVTSSGATIIWTTDQASTSQVNYGTTSSYGSSSTLDSNPVTSHSVALSGLAPSTTYHYQAVSGDANGTSQSSDATFTTAAAASGGGPQLDTKTTAFSSSGTATASVSTTVAGDLLVAFVSGDDPTTGAQTATVSSSGLTWTLAKRVNGQPGTAEVWWANATGTLSSTAVSAALANPDNVELVVESFSNAGGIGQVGGGSATSGGPTASLTTTAANSWVYGVGFDWYNGLARTVGPGQTLVDQVLQTGGTFWTQSQATVTANAGTAVTINDTAPTSDDWNLATVEILSGSAPVAPVISNVGVNSITSSGATITWTTNVPATSQVNYGLTSAYGSSSALDSSPVTSHSVTLSGLAPSTTYHYQVVSGDGSGTSQSADATFTSLSANQGSGPQVDTKTTAFSSTGTATASVSTTLPNDLIVAFVSGDEPTSTGIQTAVLSAAGLTWTLNESVPADDSVTTIATPGTAQIWTARASGTLNSLAITASLNQPANIELVVETFSNAAGIGAVGGGNATTGAPTATLTTTAANSWVWGVGFDWTKANARTVGSGQTLVDQSLQTGGTFWTQSETAVTPGAGTAVTINDTAPTNDYWNLATAEILSAVPAPAPPAVSPRTATLTFTEPQSFSDPGLTGAVTWSVDGVIGGNSTVGTISTAGLYTPPSTVGSHTVTATTSGGSGSAAVYVTNDPGMLTFNDDNGRTGQDLNETVLTPANVNSGTFGKLFNYPVDGDIFASPLYVPNVNVPGQGYHNLLIVATEHDSVYAFDADGRSSTPLWHTSFIDPANGVTTIPQADVNDPGDIPVETGISSTPVIDPATGTLYVVAATKEVSGSTVNYVQRLHALDITTGTDKLGGPVVIAGSVPGTGDGSVNGVVSFDPLREGQRSALLLTGGVVYISWASHADIPPYHGWVMGYNATTLKQTMVYNADPNGSDGGIWMSGDGPATDSTGNIYFITGNGTFDANTGGSDYGDSYEKLSPAGAVQDYFTPSDENTLETQDLDLDSGGPLIPPDQGGAYPHEIINAGKEGTVYVVNRDNMGHFNSTKDQVIQELVHIFPNNQPDPTSGGNFSAPVYFNGSVYFSPVQGPVQAFSLINGLLSTSPTSQTSLVYGGRGGTTQISADGSSNGILWTLQTEGSGNGVLHAYDASNLGDELYNSDQAGSRDLLIPWSKFTVPVVADGRVYVASSQGSITAYGLLG